MAVGGLRVVSADDIAAAELPLRDIYDLVVEGCELHGRGEFEFPPKVGVHPRPGAFTHAMPAYLPTKNLAGTKVVSVYPDNPVVGLPATNGIIVMTDPETGIPYSIVDAAWETSVRTAMVSMVDVRFLANPDPIFGIVGATGATGRAHIEAIAAMFPGSRILVDSRSPERLRALIADFASHPCEVIAAADTEQIVRDGDVVIVCTAHLDEPIFTAEWLHPGHTVLNVHARGWPSDILSSVDRVSCDDRRQVLDPALGFLGLFAGLDPDVELGEVVVGKVAGRQNQDQTIFSFNRGLAIFDILIADYILRSI